MNDRLGAYGAPAVSIPRPLEAFHVPKEGTATVRFLGAYDGIFVHWDSRRSRACPGIEQCPPALHRRGSVWKGYAPVEVYDSIAPKVWVAAVLEITERLDEILYGRTLRGEVWRLTRIVGPHGKREVTGEYLDTLTIPLRTDVPVTAVVDRIYRGAPILWGQRPKVPARLFLAPSTDAPPATVDPEQTPNGRPMSRAEVRALMEAQGARIGANGNGKGGAR